MDLHCSRCGEDKPETEFSPQPSNRSRGRSAWCKPCNAAYVRERNTDPERRAANAARVRAARTDPAVKARISEYNRRYRQANRETFRRLDNDPAKRAKDRERRRTEDGKRREVVIAERRRARMESGPGITDEQWLGRLGEFLGLCAYCLQPGRLTMEHMTPLSRGGKHEIDNVVPACRSCNSRKGRRTLIESLVVLR